MIVRPLLKAEDAIIIYACDSKIAGHTMLCLEKGRGRMSPLFLIPALSRNPCLCLSAGKI